MSSRNCGLSTRSLAELSLMISRVSRNVLDESVVPSAASIRSFWQSTRSLQQRWLMELDDWSAAGTLDMEILERLAPRIFTCEMVVRTWGTVLVGLDLQGGHDDLIRLTRNAVNGLLQIRNGLLSRLLMIPESGSPRLQEIDRLRRRCDRWTDLLLGPIATGCGCFEFAFDEERARDFGEEGLIADPATGPHAVEHLVSAGLRLAFIQYLPTEEIEEPQFVNLAQSILSSIPPQVFHRDGSLRSLLEQRIIESRMRLEGEPARGADGHYHVLGKLDVRPRVNKASVRRQCND